MKKRETLTVESEGSTLSTTATTMTFVFKTITASASVAEKTIDVRSTTTILDVTANGSSAYRFSSHYELKTIQNFIQNNFKQLHLI